MDKNIKRCIQKYYVMAQNDRYFFFFYFYFLYPFVRFGQKYTKFFEQVLFNPPYF